jgi:four helix bundle protein
MCRVSAVRNFRELVVWQRAIDLAVEVFRLTEDFPIEQRYALTDIIRRCATSVSANIAEGFGRGKDPEFGYFLRVALGSLCELESHLEVAVRVGYLPPEKVPVQSLSEIGKMINGLKSKLNTKER